MKKHKIYELLGTFSADELKEFEKFAESVYFNKGRNFSPLLRELRKFYPSFSNEKLTNRYLYTRLYPGKKYNDQVVRNLFTGLMKIAREFLVYKTSTRNRVGYYAKLADEFQNRGLYRLAERNLDLGRNELNKRGGKDMDYFRQRFEFDRVSREISIGENDTKRNIRSLSDESTNLLFFDLMEISRHVEEMTVLKHNFNANFKDHFIYRVIENINFEKLIKFAEERSLPDHKLLELYACNIQLQMNDQSEELFNKLRKLLKENFNVLSRWGKYNLFLCAENACVRLQAVNEEKYSRMLLELYSDQLEAGLYNEREGSPLAQDIFRNIVVSALKLKEYERTEKFIKKYISELPQASKENMYNFSYSLLYFERRKFEEALNYVIKVKYDTFVFKFDIKVHMLKIYHELNYTEEELSMLDTFRHFISENVSVSDYIKYFHLNFVRFLNEIVKGKNGSKEIDIGKLHKEIQSSNVRGKDWLLEKTKELAD
jgi:hypothetical protein